MEGTRLTSTLAIYLYYELSLSNLLDMDYDISFDVMESERVIGDDLKRQCVLLSLYLMLMTRCVCVKSSYV